MYSSSFADRVPHVGAVAGAEDLDVEPAQRSQRVEVGRQRALGGIDEHAALAHHRVSAEAEPPQQQADVVGGVAGSRQRAEGPDRLPARRQRDRDASGPLGKRRRALGVVEV